MILFRLCLWNYRNQLKKRLSCFHGSVKQITQDNTGQSASAETLQMLHNWFPMIPVVSSLCSCIISCMEVDPEAAALFLSACSTNPSVYVYTAVAAATTSLCPSDFHPWHADRQTGGRASEVETDRERERGMRGNLCQGCIPFWRLNTLHFFPWLFVIHIVMHAHDATGFSKVLSLLLLEFLH